ncbi:uncharacterized protein LOC129596715 [Paramacrobiotus metropolitanus]|uniref:uncharacterized protein LOC129596715 n=1 Tax=Paramacrobiotus metropolitanus TaxID=2943436 RepID=UPI002445964F|nr:uncharacterized protein LOC129596715 [Paramacrobiotus metropolitanus]
MASQGTAPKSTKACFASWVHKRWKSLSLHRKRSKGILRVDLSADVQEAITEDTNCRQILGKNLQPVVYESATRQFSLGYLCGVDWPGRRALVDFLCHNRPPRWLPAGKVRQHKPVETREILPHIVVTAALRPSSDQPYVFQPARIIFPPATDIYGQIRPICVEVTRPGSAGFIRKFVHPVQVRVVAESPGTDESLVAYCRLLLKQTARLNFCPGAPNIDLRNLLKDFNEIPWMTVVRIWLDTEGIHCVYTEKKTGVFRQADMEYLVRKSQWRHTIQRSSLPRSNSTDTENTNINRSVPLGMLPYELHECIMLQIQDIHSIISAQRVCKTWYDILNGRYRSPHVAVDLTNLLIDGPSNRERKYRLTYLLNILDNTFLSIKVRRVPVIVLKNIRCFGPLAVNFQTQRLEWANLSNLLQACQVLRLRDVTISTVFGPIAGLWCIPGGFREDVDVFVEEAGLHCSLGETDRLVYFLQLLNAGCPELSAKDVIGINEACHKIVIWDKHPLHNPLWHMLTLLNEPITMEPQPPLCRLAAHAFRYSYPKEISHHSGSRRKARSVSRDQLRHQTNGVWDIPVGHGHGHFASVTAQKCNDTVKCALSNSPKTKLDHKLSR